MRLKKYWDDLISSPFVKQSNGEIHFQPWWVWGGSYVLDSGQTEKKLRLERKYYFILSVVLLLFTPFFPLTSGLISNLLITVFILYSIRILFVVRDFPKIPRQMNFFRALQYCCRRTPWFLLILGEICCLPFILGFIYILRIHMKHPQIDVFTDKGIYSFAFFGGCFLFFSFAIWCKIIRRP